MHTSQHLTVLFSLCLFSSIEDTKTVPVEILIRVVRCGLGSTWCPYDPPARRSPPAGIAASTDVNSEYVHIRLLGYSSFFFLLLFGVKILSIRPVSFHDSSLKNGLFLGLSF
jgi:hypothetical protein